MFVVSERCIQRVWKTLKREFSVMADMPFPNIEVVVLSSSEFELIHSIYVEAENEIRYFSFFEGKGSERGFLLPTESKYYIFVKKAHPLLEELVLAHELLHIVEIENGLVCDSLSVDLDISYCHGIVRLFKLTTEECNSVFRIVKEEKGEQKKGYD